MKRIKKSPDIDVRQVQLFRDDLTFIESELKDELKVSDFKIRLGEYEYSSVSEIPIEHKKSHEISITADNPYVRIVLSRSFANLSSSDSSLKTVGALNNIVGRLNRRTRKVRRYFVLPLGILGAILLMSVSPLVTIESFPAQLKFIIIASTLLTLPFSVIATYQVLRTHSTINFEIDKRNYFTRNKDALITNLIVALLSSSATFLATRLF